MPVWLFERTTFESLDCKLKLLIKLIFDCALLVEIFVLGNHHQFGSIPKLEASDRVRKTSSNFLAVVCLISGETVVQQYNSRT